MSGLSKKIVFGRFSSTIDSKSILLLSKGIMRRNGLPL